VKTNLKEQFPAMAFSRTKAERFYSAQLAMQFARPDCHAMPVCRQPWHASCMNDGKSRSVQQRTHRISAPPGNCS